MSRLEIKSDEQLRLMRRAGRVVAEGLAAMQQAAVAGVTTAEVDQVGRDVLAAHGATSNFLGYGAEDGVGFAGVACISVNDELLHGVPGERRLRDGDLVSVDFGAVVEGWHGDAARTFCVGEATQADRDLIDASREAFWAGVAQLQPGARVNAVSRAIEDSFRG
ncbi:MAG: M24 family metallopeptidase, partial [Arachnia sp.]